MASRLKLQSTLEELLGSENVYYQPPESLKMGYPAIVYSKERGFSLPADNTKYIYKTRYQIIVISRTPDNEAINKLLSLNYSSFDREYKVDNLYHDVITLYY